MFLLGDELRVGGSVYAGCEGESIVSRQGE